MADQENTPKHETGSWYTQIGRLKRTYSSLTNADLNYEERHKQEMVKALSGKLGIAEKGILEVMIPVNRKRYT